MRSWPPPWAQSGPASVNSQVSYWTRAPRHADHRGPRLLQLSGVERLPRDWCRPTVPGLVHDEIDARRGAGRWDLDRRDLQEVRSRPEKRVSVSTIAEIRLATHIRVRVVRIPDFRAS